MSVDTHAKRPRACDVLCASRHSQSASIAVFAFCSFSLLTCHQFCSHICELQWLMALHLSDQLLIWHRYLTHTLSCHCLLQTQLRVAGEGAHFCHALCNKPRLTCVTVCCYAAMARFVDNNKKKTSILSSMLLILVPWMQISKAVTSNVPVTAAALAATVVAGIALHLVFLAFNLTATAALRLGQTANDDGTVQLL